MKMSVNRLRGAENYAEHGDILRGSEAAGVMPSTFERWLADGLMEDYDKHLLLVGREERVKKGFGRADDLTPDDVVGLIEEAVGIARERGSAKDILKAAEMLAKCMGMYNETINHDHRVVMMPEIKLGGGEVLRLGFGKEVVEQ